MTVFYKSFLIAAICFCVVSFNLSAQIINIEELKKSAKAGDPIAQADLAVTYEKAQNYERAFYWYQLAANNGDAQAQNNIGVFYYKGLFVRKNLSKALYWWQKSATQGHRQGQSNLAQMYMDGVGVAKNMKMAMEWFEKSAEQAYPLSQNNLAVIKFFDRGNLKDVVQAYKWAKLAKYFGYDSQRLINHIESSITSNQQYEGQRLASQWLEEYNQK